MAETVQHPRAPRTAGVEEAEARAARSAASVEEAEVEVVRDLETLKAEIATLKLELEKVTRAAKDVGATAYGAAKDQAEALAENLVAQGRSQVASVEQRVREQPLMALGLAFGAGLLFAKLSGR